MSEDKSEFLNIYVPHDASGLSVEIEAFDTASEAHDAMQRAMQKSDWWRDVIQIYRHPGRGPLANKWWEGGTTINYRRNLARTPPA